MSLINDALKKAQRLRAEEQATLPPMAGVRRGSAAQGGKQTMILIGAGAVVLIAVSVVITVHFLSDSPPAKIAVVVPARPTSVIPVVVVSAPASLPPVAKAPPALAPVIALPKNNAEAPGGPVTPASSFAASPDPSGPIVLTDALKSDEEIQAMVDKFRVSGVRSGGSKVLMNDHIVRVNEVVDRDTGLRLVKIEDDMLIFKDAKGTLYTKNF